MVGYKLSKNDWVTPFFVIFRSVREILLVTVFLEHPVVRSSATFTLDDLAWERSPCVLMPFLKSVLFTAVPIFSTKLKQLA